MATKIKTILLSASILTASCASPHQREAEPSVSTSVSGNREGRTFAFDFSTEKERRKAEELALQGDPERADRLSRYYAVIKRNRAEAGRWEMIAVLNGSAVAQINMASTLGTMKNEDAWNYAKALLESAARKGNERAAEMLKRHPEDVKAWRKSREIDRQQLRQLGYRGSLLADP